MNVPFVDVANLARWVTALGAERIIADLVTELELDFKRWPEFDKSARVANHSTDGVIELMPISDGQQYAFKYVNGHPKNPERGFQTVTAFGVLADVHNGYPVFAAEMTILTALRTAATSALAARHLARPDSATMALIGCGAQAEFQALGFRAVLGVDRLRIWDTDPAAMDKFERNATRLGFTVERAADAHDATLGADVVTTCTADKANATVLAAASVRPGVHLNAIGGDCPGKTELDPAILPRSEVFVEYTPQTRVEGEIQRQPADFAVTELWEVVAGLRPGRSGADAVTVFDSVGFAIEDFTALRYLQRAVEGTGYAVDLDLIADPRDPKDLFGFVTAGAFSGV
ncbi:ornithine cyclodeaminase [Cryptosporangium arvum]|uniref:Putative ornithine cyclodeaminase, mu-crystallin n=1 Tax=Cryptosporangium arvum DSM 44712 TaxID=927661 RepID=A0A010ZWS2_9ACTN|nr:ornithine cyclodeaminase [Cryptosporangium arvum]EXG81672.1 putative ornithine cyclodeaminase, mu-crystallin [Cryptosporangium arvum DSM 44712]